MKIEIKKSKKPIDYNKAVKFLEERLLCVYEKKLPNLIWTLRHPSIFTAGISFKENEILDKKINIIKTNRGGKITYHGPGQLICYFVIDLKKRKKDIRKFITIIEKTIIKTLNEYKINCFSDKKNVGIWIKKNNKVFKIAAIGVRVSKWIAYHGFSINISTNLKFYNKIIPCGITDKGITNLNNIKKQDYSKLDDKIVKNFIKYLKI